MNLYYVFSPWLCRRLAILMVAACWLGVGLSATASAQKLDNFDRDRGSLMLKVIKDEIKKSYYDPAYHGVDVEERFKAAEEKIKTATSLGQVFGIIAQAMLDLNDSHTFFFPPQRSSRTSYGWQMQMMGDKCYVIAVQPGSDAEAKGLKPGDQLLTVNGFIPTRENFWKMRYLFNVLRPQPGLHVDVVSPEGQRRPLDVNAKVTQGKVLMDLTRSADIHDLILELENDERYHRHRYIEMNDEAFIWKMPAFDLTEQGVDEMMNKAKKRQALILDLRGNPGGAEITLKRLLGYFFDHDVKVGDIKARKDTKPLMVKTRGGDGFKGKLVVLIDSNSGSSAEIFARMIQMEKRGAVIGDQSAGAVMRARHYGYTMGADTIVPYGASITEADLVMTDGKSLEGTGVKPDEWLLPIAADLAAKRDPVMTRAAELVGVKLPPEKAGTMFPIEWRK